MRPALGADSDQMAGHWPGERLTGADRAALRAL
jgi:hypothetical protein